jgi:hypothetical protein
MSTEYAVRLLGKRARETAKSTTIDVAGAEILAEKLERDGVCVLVHQAFVERIRRLETCFDSALESFPEYKRSAGREPLYVFGSFGALGNAASFHNGFVRFLRRHVMAALYPMFAALTKNSGNNIAQIADRMLYRRPNVKPVADKWHRDTHPDLAPGERVFGGWINLSQHTQYLSCKCGTHRDPIVVGTNGFAVVSDEQIAELTQQRRDGKTDLIEVPPGGVIVFDERILHEVMAKPVPHAVKRLFMAWLETPTLGRFHPPNLAECLATQAPLTLKSNQTPQMYFRNDYRFRQRELHDWARRDLVAPAMIVEQNGLPHREAPSLESLARPYFPYEDDEIALFYAARKHRLPAHIGDDTAEMLRDYEL